MSSQEKESTNRVIPHYEEKCASHCCRVPIPAVFINPLDENQKRQLFKGCVPHWRWVRDPKGKIEYSILKSWHPDYDYYSKRFSDASCPRQENNFGRTEDMYLLLEGYGPKGI